MRDTLDIQEQEEKVVKSATFELVDEATGERLRVVVVQDAYGLNIKPEGYGDCKFPIALDFFKGSKERVNDPLRVLVWSDPELEDPTHMISLDLVKNKEKE